MKNWSFISQKSQKIAAFATLFWFSVTKQSLENVLTSPNDQKYPGVPLVLKFNVTLARPLRLVIPYIFLNGNSCQMIGASIFMTANET